MKKLLLVAMAVASVNCAGDLWDVFKVPVEDRQRPEVLGWHDALQMHLNCSSATQIIQHDSQMEGLEDYAAAYAQTSKGLQGFKNRIRLLKSKKK